MKLKALLFIFCVSVFGQSFANNIAANASDLKAPKSAKLYGVCEIQIVNRSYDDVIVNGIYDNGARMHPFTVYAHEAPRYIDLVSYDGYCHYGMNLYIETYSGYPVYSGFTPTDSTIVIEPIFGNKAKAKVIPKSK